MTSQFNDIPILEKYYDIVRIIDPLSEVPLPPGNSHTDKHKWDCCHTGSSSIACKNCVALQAVRQKETFFKIEMRHEQFFMVTAIPIESAGRTLALELIKCVSEKAVASFPPIPEKNTDIYRSIAKLNDLAIKDALTNIYNRRYIDEQLPLEAAFSLQRNLPFSVIMADIDYFKQINDHYGHPVGDEILKRFAAQLQNNIRSKDGDWVARYGGEEFLIVLSNCPEYQAYTMAEKLRKVIEKTSFVTSAGTLRITASFGVHTFAGQENDLKHLVDKADIQLYQAKQTGRNCTASTKIFCTGPTDTA